MDDPLLAWGLIVVLVVVLVAVIWLLVMQCRKGRKHRPPSTRHVFRGQGEAITVAELVREARDRGEPVRLYWPDESYRVGLMRPYVQDKFPTVIMPKAQNLNAEDEG